MITSKIERKDAFLRFENKPPRQAGATFVQMPAQFADPQSRVRVRIPESLPDEF